jgi:hypothetical protein
VTVQTLDEKTFDAGTVLAQTPFPGIPIPADSTPALLRDLLAPIGAEMLVAALRKGLHVPPTEDVGWRRNAKDLQPPRDAPKLTTRDRQVEWAAPGWSASAFQLHDRVLGRLWSRALHSSGAVKRVILEGVEEIEAPEEAAVFLRRVQKRLDTRAKAGSDTSPGTPLPAGETSREARETWEGAEFEAGEVGPPQVNMVTWLQEVDPSPALPSHQTNWREFRMPYFLDGDAIIIPAVGGGCVRIANIKIEGEKSKAAATGIEALRDRRQDHEQGLEDFVATLSALPLEAVAGELPWLSEDSESDDADNVQNL